MQYRSWSRAIAAVVAVGISAMTATSLLVSRRVSAQENFPDVQDNYWAKPFIQALAEKDIIVGYLDGSFKPEKPLNRDEFAAMIRKAFNQNRVREIQSGSVFADVPQNYWAAPPIEEAYEAGFMNAYEGNLFKPTDEILKAQAIADLMKGLRMSYDRPTTTVQQPQSTPVAQQQPQNQRRRMTKNRLMFPVAMTAMMYPIMRLPSPQPQQQAPAKETEPVAAAPQNAPQGASALEFLNTYYEDANQIPDYAVDDVAAATQANIVVNYPNLKILNPNEVLKRGAAAALIHQALVSQGKLEPVEGNNRAAEYVVKPTPQPEATPAEK